MKASLDAIKDLRNMTSASIAECKKALEETAGNMDKAVKLLRQRGLELAAKKAGSGAKEGRVEAYVHLGNKIGVIVEVDCQTDFVAKNSEFCQFTKDLAMHIAACGTTYLKNEDVPAEIIEQEKDKELFYKTHCLLSQPFVKDPAITINDYLASIIAKFSENIFIRRFMRYKIGE